jgi:hypothetical protein
MSLRLKASIEGGVFALANNVRRLNTLSTDFMLKMNNPLQCNIRCNDKLSYCPYVNDLES